MPVCFEQAPQMVYAVAEAIMTDFHEQDLRFKGRDGPEYPRLCILFAFTDDDEPAVKRDGYAVAAVTSVIPLKQRVDKRADAEIIIDRAAWEDLADGQQRALLDHCITSLEMKTDENGCVKTDDIGRPQLKIKLCDWNLRGFRSVARRWGEEAPEVIAAKAFEADFGLDVLEKGKLFA